MKDIINTKDFINELKTNAGDYPDSKRVVSVIEDILAFKDPTKVDWYFSEVHGQQDHMENYLDTLTFHTVYDSSWIPGIGDYNIVSIATDPERMFGLKYIVAISLNGSRLSSALTEYIRF